MDIQNLNDALKNLNIKALCTNYKKVDNYSFYDLKLLARGRVKDLHKYGDEISLAIRANTKPNIKILHDQGLVRLEFASPRKTKLNLFDHIVKNDALSSKTLCYLGQSIDGQKIHMDLSQNPHMIVAGTTGSGKSSLLHNIIANLLNNGGSRILLVDPKKIEFEDYRKILDDEVINSYDETIDLFDSLYDIMEFRYNLINSSHGNNIQPIVVIIDEFADLIIQDKDDNFYKKLFRLAAKCRAAQIYLILSTQRPSVDIVNGSIKANFPARISCKVANHFDSKIILDDVGAENLIGNGDAYLKDNTRNMERFQIAFISPQEIRNKYAK